MERIVRHLELKSVKGLETMQMTKTYGGLFVISVFKMIGTRVISRIS